MTLIAYCDIVVSNVIQFFENGVKAVQGCFLCPRKCGIDRRGGSGFCRQKDEVMLAKAYLHKFEEPCISGVNGSGTVFFCGCNLHCVFCQNSKISRTDFGKPVSVQRLAEIFRELERQGAHNINLVTPTVWADKIKAAIKIANPNIPVIYNCGGYENADIIRGLKGYVQIFMPDIKFFSPALSARYMQAADYFGVAAEALGAMAAAAGEPQFDSGGLMTGGVLVRHLVMPSHFKDSLDIINELYRRFGSKAFVLSLMNQYYPCGDARLYPEINRRTTTYEYEKVLKAAADLGFKGYSQERSSASKIYTPDFDFLGI